jgi:hypothetical protein
MAQIRRPQARGVKSAFQNVAPATGGAFRVLAQVAETAYSRLAPAAEQEMLRNGAAVGNDSIKQQVGENPIVTPGVSHDGVSPAAKAAFATRPRTRRLAGPKARSTFTAMPSTWTCRTCRKQSVLI